MRTLKSWMMLQGMMTQLGVYQRNSGLVGTHPWTEMERNRLGLLSNDLVFPVSFTAIETVVLRRKLYTVVLHHPMEL